MGGPSRLTLLLLTLTAMSISVKGGDNNHVYSPCRDTTVQRYDGFTFGIAFSSKGSFFPNNNSSNLARNSHPATSASISLVALSSHSSAPKVDEISVLIINTSSFSPDSYGGFMVAFAGSKYAARSPPTFVANDTYIVTSFTLVLEFQKGRLHNLYWKKDGCASCKGKSKYVCINKSECAINIKDCKGKGGSMDCIIGIQLAFSGTDKHYEVLNSWYEVENLRQYSLYGLYSSLRNSLTGQYNKIF